MNTGIHVGDVGTVIELDTGADISTATTVGIKYKKPDNSTGEWTGSVSTIDGVQSGVSYTLQSGDIDQCGLWIMHAHVIMPTWQGHGGRVGVTIYPI